MRDTAMPNDQESARCSPNGIEDDASGVFIDRPVPSPLEHAGYILLENGTISNPSTDEEEEVEEDLENANREYDSASDPLDEARVDEVIRRALNSDGTHFGSFSVSEEPKDEPDESSPALLWNEPRKNNDKRISLPDEKAAEIKACLSGFKLPENCLPSWAREIPEEVWKQHLLQRLSSQSTSSTSKLS